MSKTKKYAYTETKEMAIVRIFEMLSFRVTMMNQRLRLVESDIEKLKNAKQKK